MGWLTSKLGVALGFLGLSLVVALKFMSGKLKQQDRHIQSLERNAIAMEMKGRRDVERAAFAAEQLEAVKNENDLGDLEKLSEEQDLDKPPTGFTAVTR